MHAADNADWSALAAVRRRPGQIIPELDH